MPHDRKRKPTQNEDPNRFRWAGPKGAQRPDATEPLRAMAEAGLGVALLPDFLVAEAISPGRLAAVLDQYIDDRRDICILWPSSRQSQPKIKAFVDFMAARLDAH